MANASLKNFKLEDFAIHSGNFSDSSDEEHEFKADPSDSFVNVKTENDDSKPFDISHIVKTELIYNQDDDDSDDKEKDKDWTMGKAYSCPFCKASFNKANNMKSHIKRIHTTYKPEDCHCEPCNKSFKNPDCLKAHIKEFHTPGVDRTPQLCTHCGKSFNKKSNLKVHILNSHTKYDPVDCICSQCGKLFKNPLSMKRHVETFHDEEKKAEMVVVCPDCGKQFNKRTNLKIHMECVHTTYKPGEFICTLCSKELKNPHSLKSHMREVHTVKDDSVEQVIYKCDECEKEFKKKKDLRGHKYAAHKIDVKMCEFCFNEYKNQTALKQHLRLVHGPEQQVSCEICFKTFKNMTRLKHHHIDVHKIDNSVCPDCGKSFKNKFLMKKHLRYLHRGPNGARVKQPKLVVPKDDASFGQPITQAKTRKPRKPKLNTKTSESLNVIKTISNNDTNSDVSLSNSSQNVKPEYDPNYDRKVDYDTESVSGNRVDDEQADWHQNLTQRLAAEPSRENIRSNTESMPSNHEIPFENDEPVKRIQSGDNRSRTASKNSNSDSQESTVSQIVQHPKNLWKQYQADEPQQETSRNESPSEKPNRFARGDSNVVVQPLMQTNQQNFSSQSSMVHNVTERMQWNNMHMVDRDMENKQSERSALNLSPCERSSKQDKSDERIPYHSTQGFGPIVSHHSAGLDKSMWSQNLTSRHTVEYNAMNNPILDYRYRERSFMDHNPMSYFNQVQHDSLGLNLIHNDRNMMHHDTNRRSVIDQMQSERSMLDHIQNARSVFEQMQMQSGRSALDHLLNSRQGFDSMQHMQNTRSLWDQAGQNRR